MNHVPLPYKKKAIEGLLEETAMRTVNTRLTPSPIGPRGKPIITLTLLKDFADGFQTSYPFSLPVQRSMDYFIVLERDYKPPARCIYVWHHLSLRN